MWGGISFVFSVLLNLLQWHWLIKLYWCQGTWSCIPPFTLFYLLHPVSFSPLAYCCPCLWESSLALSFFLLNPFTSFTQLHNPPPFWQPSLWFWTNVFMLRNSCSSNSSVQSVIRKSVFSCLYIGECKYSKPEKSRDKMSLIPRNFIIKDSFMNRVIGKEITLCQGSP